MKTAYNNYKGIPKIIFNDSFDYRMDMPLVTIADDPDILKKCASSEVVDEWGPIEPVKNHSVIHLIAMGADEVTGPNRNGDGFKAAFLKKAHPTFKEHGALYRNHVNKDYSKRDGDVIKTAFWEKMGRAELLVAANHDKCADWLSDIEAGKKVAFSMGFDCDHDVCSICSNKAKNRTQYCEHVNGKNTKYGMCKILDDGRRCYVDNPEGVFNDISKVGRPADMIAYNLRKVAGLDTPEIIEGGAELAERLFRDMTGTTDRQRYAIKLGEIEKRVYGVGQKLVTKKQRPVKLDKKAADALRMMPVNRMFSELARMNIVLPFQDFFKLAMGEMYAEIEPMVLAGAERADLCFSEVTTNPDLMDVVMVNNKYACQKLEVSNLSERDRYVLQKEYSLEPVIASARLMKQACEARADLYFRNNEKTAADKNLQVEYLLAEYAAYKLAALEAMDLPKTEEILYLATAL